MSLRDPGRIFIASAILLVFGCNRTEAPAPLEASANGRTSKPAGSHRGADFACPGKRLRLAAGIDVRDDIDDNPKQKTDFVAPNKQCTVPAGMRRAIYSVAVPESDDACLTATVSPEGAHTVAIAGYGGDCDRSESFLQCSLGADRGKPAILSGPSVAGDNFLIVWSDGGRYRLIVKQGDCE